MIVEYQQIAPVIDRRRTMLPNDPTTRFAACATVIGIHHTERRSCPGSPSRSSRQILRRKIPGQDHHVVRTAQFRPKVEFFASFSLPGSNLQTTSALDRSTNVELPFSNSASGKVRTGSALPSQYRKRPVAAIEKGVLQLHRPLIERFRPDAGIVKAVLSVAQPMKHKRLRAQVRKRMASARRAPGNDGPGRAGRSAGKYREGGGVDCIRSVSLFEHTGQTTGRKSDL